MPNVHPLFVHGRIVLLLFAPFLDVVGYVRRDHAYHRVAVLVLALGVVGTAASIGTGYLAAHYVFHTPAAGQVIETHETLALVLGGLALVLLAIRWLARDETARRRLALVIVAEIVVLGTMVPITSYFGGELVYHYGVGTPLLTPGGPGAKGTPRGVVP